MPTDHLDQTDHMSDASADATRQAPGSQDTRATDAADTAQVPVQKVIIKEVPKKETGLSVSQIVAPALAALTSFLMSSQIGIAGSVIGVVVGSIVATVSSQAYKHVLNASAEKIRDIASTDGQDVPDVTTRLADTAHEADASQSPYVTASADQTTRLKRADPSRIASEADATQVAAENGATRVAPASVRAAAATRESKATARKVMVVGIIVAIVAVLATALVINLATSGEGIGTKTDPIFSPASTTAQTTAATADHAAATKGAPSATTSAQTQEAATGSQTQEATTGSQEDATSGSSAQTQGTTAKTQESATTSAASTAAASTTVSKTTSGAVAQTSSD